MNVCDSNAVVWCAGFAYNGLTRTVLLSDATSNRIVLATSIQDQPPQNCGGIREWKDCGGSDPDIALVIHGKGLLIINLENASSPDQYPCPQNRQGPVMQESAFPLTGRIFIRDSRTQSTRVQLETFFKDNTSLQASIPAESLPRPARYPSLSRTLLQVAVESDVCTFKIYNPAHCTGCDHTGYCRKRLISNPVR